jgi:hypothetical protein
VAITRIHTKNSAQIFDFLQRNEKNFQIEKTSSGFPTFNFKDKAIYVRDKAVHRGSLNKIMTFQSQVSKSELYEFVNKKSLKFIKEESDRIEKTILYKGFIFNPNKEESFKKVIKIDLNTAYLQTCRYFPIIKGEIYRDIIKRCTKKTRLRITGTLGKKVYLTDYVNGKKRQYYVREDKKRRIVFQNIYNRIRKFVDELMMWCWQKNPDNFIGFYVDCVWLREYDAELIEKLKTIYKLKIELVDMEVKRNSHGRVVLWENNEEEVEEKPYDAQFKPNEFVSYKNMYNFTSDLKKVNFKIHLKKSNKNDGK